MSQTLADCTGGTPFPRSRADQPREWTSCTQQRQPRNLRLGQQQRQEAPVGPGGHGGWALWGGNRRRAPRKVHRFSPKGVRPLPPALHHHTGRRPDATSPPTIPDAVGVEGLRGLQKRHWPQRVHLGFGAGVMGVPAGISIPKGDVCRPQAPAQSCINTAGLSPVAPCSLSDRWLCAGGGHETRRGRAVPEGPVP